MKALSDTKVVMLGNFVAGNTAGRWLAGIGMDVVKVESLQGDPWRTYGALMQAPAKYDEYENPIFDTYNANMRCISLDLRSEKGREIFDKLLAQADIFITNNRPQSLKKNGLDYDTLKEKYPTLIFGELTGYGFEGPDVDAAGFDTIAYYARSGIMADLVMKGEHPITSMPCGGDDMIGVMLWGGVLSALINREQTGKGCRVDLSIFGAAVWNASCPITTSQPKYGYPYPKERAAQNPLGMAYKTKDGEWVELTILEWERYAEAFCDALQIPNLMLDERFKDQPSIRQHKEEIVQILDDAFIKWDSEEIHQRLLDRDIAHLVLGHFKNVTKDPQAVINKYVIEYPVGKDGNDKSWIVPMPVHYTDMEVPEFKRGPLLGEDTKQVMAELGYGQDDISKAIADGVVYQHD